MPRTAALDDLFDYLRHCGGRDDLSFKSVEAAHTARQVLIDRLDSQGVDLIRQPEMLVFENTLSIRLRKESSNASPRRPASVRS